MNLFAQIGGPIAALGVAGLLLGKERRARLLGLALMVVGGLTASAVFAPGFRYVTLAIVVVVGIVSVASLFVVFRRWPSLLPVITLACVPARFPIRFGGSIFNSFAPLYAVIMAATLSFALEIYRGDDRRRELGPIAWPITAFVGWSAISLIWTNDAIRGATELDAPLLAFTLLAVALARLHWTPRLLKGLLAELVLMSLFFALVGVYQYETHIVFWNPKVINSNAYAPFFRVNSVFWDPSIYGRFVVVAILACLALVVTNAGRRWKTVATLVIAALWAGVALSFSQSSFAALTAGLVAAALVTWGRRAAIPLALATLLIVPVVLMRPQIYTRVFDGKHHNLKRITSTRSTLVGNGIQIALKHPIVGVGIGGFRRAYAARTGLSTLRLSKGTSHTTIVTVAAEGGVIGLALYLWLLAAALIATYRRVGPDFAGRVQLVCALSLTAIAVHSLFYADFFEDPTTWALLAIAVGAPLTLSPEGGRVGAAAVRAGRSLSKSKSIPAP